MYQRFQNQESLKSSENFSSNSLHLKVFCFQSNAVMSLAGLSNNFLSLKIRTATRGCLAWIVQKRARRGKWRWPLWQSCLPKIYYKSQNHNFQCLPLFQIIMYKDCECTTEFDSQALVLEGCKVHFHCTGHQH